MNAYDYTDIFLFGIFTAINISEILYVILKFTG